MERERTRVESEHVGLEKMRTFQLENDYEAKLDWKLTEYVISSPPPKTQIV